MEQSRQRKQPQRQLVEVLKTTPAVIPVQQRRIVDDEADTDVPVTPAAQPLPDTDDELSERERLILDFERQGWRHSGAKEQAIREKFELSGTRYYQILNALLDKPAALEHDPVLVARLRRLRGSRSRARGR